MSDKPIFTKVIGHKAIIVTASDIVDTDCVGNNNFFAIKVIDLYDDDCKTNNWSLNKGEDMCLVIRSLITEDFSLLKECSWGITAFIGDLYRNEIIDEELYNEL